MLRLSSLLSSLVASEAATLKAVRFLMEERRTIEVESSRGTWSGLTCAGRPSGAAVGSKRWRCAPESVQVPARQPMTSGGGPVQMALALSAQEQPETPQSQVQYGP